VRCICPCYSACVRLLVMLQRDRSVMVSGFVCRVPKNRKVLQKIFEDPKPKVLVFVSKVTMLPPQPSESLFRG